MSNFSAGVETLIKRMETNPDEFFGEAYKWRFIFNANFREVLTEPEKGAIHEALKAVRRKEFDYNVMQTLLNEEAKEHAQQQMLSAAQRLKTGYDSGVISASSYNEASVKREGAPVLSLGSFK